MIIKFCIINQLRAAVLENQILENDVLFLKDQRDGRKILHSGVNISHSKLREKQKSQKQQVFF